MKRHQYWTIGIAAVSVLVALSYLVPAPAQVLPQPGPPVPIAGAYNSGAVTLTNGQAGWVQLDSSGNLKTSTTTSTSSPELAPVAPATATATKSVLLGGQYDSTQKTLTNGQQAAISASARGAVIVATGVDSFTTLAQPQAIATGGASFLNIAAGQATTTVKSGAGTLYSICLNSAATATNTTILYDNTAGSGTVIARPAATTATVPTCLSYGPAGLAFATGLTFVTATANGSDMTVVYK